MAPSGYATGCHAMQGIISSRQGLPLTCIHLLQFTVNATVTTNMYNTQSTQQNMLVCDKMIKSYYAVRPNNLTLTENNIH